MARTNRITVLMVGLLVGGACFGQTPSAPPAGATGLCNDGSYWTAPAKRGACHGHKGVKQWFGAASGSATVAPATPGSTPAQTSSTTAAASTAAASTATAPAAAGTATPKAATAAASSKISAAAAPGGGPGLVWTNSASKVYHCSGDRWYGKTKNGSYMSEADAVAQGNHPDHGKACH